MWFAVDADGNVALFDSGEAGAVPDEAYLGEEYTELVERCSELPDTRAVASRHPGPLYNRKEHVQGIGSPMLVFLRSVEDVADLVAGGKVAPIPAFGEAAVRMVYTTELYARLHDGGLCRHCRVFYGNVDGSRDEEDPSVGEHGLYEFIHASDNVIAGPYERVYVPDRPLKADALPAELRKVAVRFAGRFAETTALQPVEHWPSQAWGAAWTNVEGKIARPLPGRERDFAGERPRDDDMDLEWDATPTTPPASKKPWWKIW